QGDPAQALDEHITHRGKPQPQLVGSHGRGRGAVCKQIYLALLDAVLHLAARAVDVFIERAGIAVSRRQRGDDEARVSLALRPLRLGDDTALPAPALARRPDQLLEAARRLARCPAFV